ncbi:MFS transporter [Streptomyces sp. HB2AG]|uniref:MFS transporter n=1 Tax=Streptomyces sp. HB2AG TaxID=2983400 RepID=UPI0022AAFA3A|nr:MFS transporter [Streptomyces sp. HB2AG]MCZ2527206.1 MFS transporter [Streptomyces sp. HB2AG]
MRSAGYLELLRTRHAARLLAGTLVGRLPHGMAALAIALAARADGAGYTLAGALTALFGLAVAVGQPLLGRWVDRRGQPRVMLPAAVLSAAGFAVYAAVGTDPLPVAVAAVLLAGVAAPPLEAGLRALWPDVLRRPDRVHAAYALDASAQEVMFAVGPLLVTAATALVSPAGAVLATGLFGLLGTLAVVTSPPSRAWRAEARETHWLGPLRSSGLLALLGSLFFVGTALGSISVAVIAYDDARGGRGDSGYLLSALAVGALAGGLAYGAREWPGVPERRLRLLVAALAVCYLPLALAPGLPAMAALTALAGLFLAPVLACAFVVVDRHAPLGTVTEAFSWLVTAFGVGAALGSGAAGPAAEYGGVEASFSVAGAGGAAALVVLLATSRALAPPRAVVAGPTGGQELTRKGDPVTEAGK